MADRRTVAVAFATALAAVVALAGCGGSDGAPPEPTLREPVLQPPEGGEIVIEADPGGELRFDVGSVVITAGEGEAVFVLRNRSGVVHDLAIRGNGVTLGPTPRIARGTTSLTVRLTSGRYEFVCTVGDHAAAGMTGDLLVR